MGRQGVAAAGGVDEHRVLVRAPRRGGLEAVASLVGQPGGVDVVALGAAHPAFLGEHHGHRLRGHQLGFGQGLGLGAGDDRRTTVVAVGLGILDQFFAHQLLQLGVAAEQRQQLLLFLQQLVLLAADLHFFQPRQLAQAGIEDVVGLDLGEAETLHQHRLGLVLGADDVDHFVQVEEGDQQAVQQVQALFHLVQAELQAPAHRADAVGQPFAEQGAQVLDLGLAVQADDVGIDPVTGFQVGGGEQVLHQLIGIHPVGARDDDDAGGVLVVRLVAQVGDHRQLLRLHLAGDLLQHLGPGDLVRQRGDHDVAVLDAINGAHAHRAAAALVDLQQFGAGGDDFRLGGEVRAEDMLAELLHRGVRLVQQAHAGGGHFPQVVRRHVGGHAHGDAGGAVEQQVGQARRQGGRLVQGAVEVRHPVHRALAQFGEQHLGVARQARLGVTHGGEGLGIVRRTPVALAVHQGVAVAERLGHQHHGLVAGRVAVGVELAEHVADGTRRFLVLGVGIQAQLAHGVDDAPLHRLQAVADMRQGAVHDHVHGVVEVGLFGEVGQGAALNAFQAQIEGFAHACLTGK
ncbi:hypothetical protein D9M68_413400 [compost metagenome]